MSETLVKNKQKLQTTKNCKTIGSSLEVSLPRNRGPFWNENGINIVFQVRNISNSIAMFDEYELKNPEYFNTWNKNTEEGGYQFIYLLSKEQDIIINRLSKQDFISVEEGEDVEEPYDETDVFSDDEVHIGRVDVIGNIEDNEDSEDTDDTDGKVDAIGDTEDTDEEVDAIENTGDIEDQEEVFNDYCINNVYRVDINENNEYIDYSDVYVDECIDFFGMMVDIKYNATPLLYLRRRVKYGSKLPDTSSRSNRGSCNDLPPTEITKELFYLYVRLLAKKDPVYNNSYRLFNLFNPGADWWKMKELKLTRREVEPQKTDDILFFLDKLKPNRFSKNPILTEIDANAKKYNISYKKKPDNYYEWFQISTIMVYHNIGADVINQPIKGGSIH